MRLLFRDGPMRHTLRHDEELAAAHGDLPILQFDVELAPEGFYPVSTDCWVKRLKA